MVHYLHGDMDCGMNASRRWLETGLQVEMLGVDMCDSSKSIEELSSIPQRDSNPCLAHKKL